MVEVDERGLCRLLRAAAEYSTPFIKGVGVPVLPEVGRAARLRARCLPPILPTGPISFHIPTFPYEGKAGPAGPNSARDRTACPMPET